MNKILISIFMFCSCFSSLERKESWEKKIRRYSFWGICGAKRLPRPSRCRRQTSPPAAADGTLRGSVWSWRWLWRLALWTLRRCPIGTDTAHRATWTGPWNRVAIFAYNKSRGHSIKAGRARWRWPAWGRSSCRFWVWAGWRTGGRGSWVWSWRRKKLVGWRGELIRVNWSGAWNQSIDKLSQMENYHEKFHTLRNIKLWNWQEIVKTFRQQKNPNTSFT